MLNKKFLIVIICLIILIPSIFTYVHIHKKVVTSNNEIIQLESKNKKLKESISNMGEYIEIQKERLSMTKKEIEKYGSGAITKSNSTESLLGKIYHPTQEEYEKDYSNYIFKKKILSDKKAKYKKNEEVLDKLKKQTKNLSLFK